jgi:hypothetical protein
LKQPDYERIQHQIDSQPVPDTITSAIANTFIFYIADLVKSPPTTYFELEGQKNTESITSTLVVDGDGRNGFLVQLHPVDQENFEPKRNGHKRSATRPKVPRIGSNLTATERKKELKLRDDNRNRGMEPRLSAHLRVDGRVIIADNIEDHDGDDQADKDDDHHNQNENDGSDHEGDDGVDHEGDDDGDGDDSDEDDGIDNV